MALSVPHTLLLEEVADQVARDENLGGILDDLLHQCARFQGTLWCKGLYSTKGMWSFRKVLP